jgi:drug/metabolite transporter (DMT)-like permease
MSTSSPASALVYASRPSQVRLALAALLFGGIVSGCSPVFVRLSEVGPMATGLWRLGLAVPALFAYLLLEESRGIPRRVPTWRDAALIVFAGLFFGIDIAVWHLSVKYTTITEATLLTLLAPLFVTAGAWFLYGERFGRTFFIGLTLAFAGTAVLVLLRPVGTLPIDRPLGVVCGLAAAVTYAIYLLLIRGLRRSYPVTTIVTATTAVSALVLLPLSLVEPGPIVPVSAIGWLVVLFLAWGAHAFGQGVVAFALAHLPVSFSSLIQFYQAAIAAVAAWMLLSEPVGVATVLCGLTIFAGIWLCRRGSHQGS